MQLVYPLTNDECGGHGVGAELGAGVGVWVGGGGCDDCSGPEEAEERAGTSLRFRVFRMSLAFSGRSARRLGNQSRRSKL